MASFEAQSLQRKADTYVGVVCVCVRLPVFLMNTVSAQDFSFPLKQADGFRPAGGTAAQEAEIRGQKGVCLEGASFGVLQEGAPFRVV